MRSRSWPPEPVSESSSPEHQLISAHGGTSVTNENAAGKAALSSVVSQINAAFNPATTVALCPRCPRAWSSPASEARCSSPPSPKCHRCNRVPSPAQCGSASSSRVLATSSGRLLTAASSASVDSWKQVHSGLLPRPRAVALKAAQMVELPAVQKLPKDLRTVVAKRLLPG